MIIASLDGFCQLLGLRLAFMGGPARLDGAAGVGGSCCGLQVSLARLERLRGVKNRMVRLSTRIETVSPGL